MILKKGIVLLLTFMISCQEEESIFKELNYKIKKIELNSIIKISSEKNIDSKILVDDKIIKLIPKDQLYFLREEIKLSYKLKDYYNYDLENNSSFYLDGLYVFNMDYYLLIIKSAFGGVNNYPSRKKVFLFKQNELLNSFNASGVLLDSSETLVYNSDIFLEDNRLIMKRFELFLYESIIHSNDNKQEKKTASTSIILFTSDNDTN